MKKMLLLLFALAFTSISIHAQDMGKIQGVVVDGETGEPLIGANVVIKDETGVPIYGTSTDLDGRFALTAPTGTHNVEFSYISYATKTVTGVELKTDAPTSLNISLPPEAMQADEIVVTAQSRTRQRSIDARHTAKSSRSHGRHQRRIDEPLLVFRCGRCSQARNGNHHCR